MTIVDASIDAGEARRLTERIRLIAGNIADNVEKLRSLVAEAKASNVHEVLGYASWTAYLQDVFGDEPLRLARDVRQELVAELAAQGMSVRSIAPIVGVSKSQVADDVAQVSSSGHLDSAEFEPRASDWVVPDLPVNPNTGEVYEAGDEDDRGEAVVVVEQSITEKTRTVTGLDGKTYTTSGSQKPNRRALTDVAKDAGWDIRKSAEKLLRIREDDRFSRNRDEVSALLRAHLIFTIETCQGLLDDIEKGNA